MKKKETDTAATGMEVAIIGMTGRFPGAKDIAEFWENLKNGVESIEFFSDKELEEAGVEPGVMENANYVKAAGGILEDKDLFDASFFGYTPKEAQLMEPQMRIFHECAWQALEDAGCDPEAYDGLIGVYAGAASSLYWEVLSFVSGKRNEIGDFPAFLLTDKDFINSKVSYNLDLKGPTFSVQSACSTSLVAVHLGCRALLTGECNMALAGGIRIVPTQRQGYLYQQGMIAPSDGHCRAFDARADGTILTEGVGIVVMKRLKNAIADGDHIYAVIKGSAINNDGRRKVGFEAPSVDGQAEVIRRAHRIARVEPETIGYIETHGTGTSLGDPVEIKALKLAFDTDKKGICAIGSVKTNVGHLDSAAGVTGLIKTVLALKHRLIPPSLHFETPNPGINFENSPFYVNTRLMEWKNEKDPARAGVSAFGIGGTNAHMVLEAWRMEQGARGEESRDRQLILLSAKSKPGLDKMTGNLAKYLRQKPAINLADAAYTLQVGRRAFQYRRMSVCSTADEAIEALSSLDSTKVKTFRAKGETSVIFMFPGLGAQYVNMGLELYQKEPVFKEEMNRCFEILNPLLDYDIKEILYPPAAGSQQPAASPEAINQVEISQVLIFIFEYSLARMLINWGIKPEAMIGYSFGEYAAACISGVFSLEDALKLVVSRGQLIKKMPAGTMLSVPLTRGELEPLLDDGGELALAIDNGPSCIAAGPTPAAAALENQLKNRKILCMRVQTSHAIHSKMMEPILKEYEREAAQVSLNKPQIPYISNVTGDWIIDRQTGNSYYWVEHLRKPVKFADGIKELVKQGDSIFIEIGPGRDLTTLVRRYFDAESGHQAIDLVRQPRKDISDVSFLLDRIGRLWLWGVKIDWQRFYPGEKRYRVSLPTYPFERQRFWIEGDPFEIGAKTAGQDLLFHNQPIADWFYIPSWKRTMRPPVQPGDMPAPACWLLFIDDCDLGYRLKEKLEQRAQQVITVKPGTAFKRESSSAFTINPRKGFEKDYDTLFDEIAGPGQIPGKIVHLWSINRRRNNPYHLDMDRVDSVQDSGLYSLLNIVQAIGRKHIDQQVEFTVVTNNMQEVTGGDGWSPETSTVLGPVKIIPAEYSNLRFSNIDIDIELSNAGIVDRLLEELTVGISDPVVAFRGFHRWVPVYEPMPLEESSKKNLILKQGGVYLITGGLGGIGLYLAEYLAKTAGARLVLTGRSALPPEDQWEEWLAANNEDDAAYRKILKMKELRDAGAELLVFSADVTDGEQMKEVINRTLKAFGQLNGVIHAAGLPDGEVIQLRTRETTEKVLAAKIRGTAVLDKVLKGIPLDFFIFCSSTASVLGGIGQVGYCAANNFLDAFAHYKRFNDSNGTSYISINWDRWKDVGIAAIAEKVHRRLAGNDLPGGMTAGEGMDVFGRILAHPLPQVVVSTRDLGTMIEEAGKPIYLTEDIDGSDAMRDSENSFPRPELNTEYAAPGNEIQQTLTDTWAKFFGFERVGIHDDFFELGGDSLKAMIMVEKIHKNLNVEIPLQEFFNRPTVEELAEYIIHYAKKTAFVSIEPAEEKEYYELSSAQKRLYILQQMDLESTTYHVTTMVALEGDLDIKKTGAVFRQLITRHESLRTSFETIDGKGFQRVHPEVAFEIEYHDAVRKVQHKEEQHAPCESIINNFIKPFELSLAPLMRAGMIKVAERKHIFMVDMHHIISDGISMDILIKEFITLYGGEELPGLNIQYKDFSGWQNNLLASKEMEKQETFWLDKLKGNIPRLNMPLDYQRPVVKNFEGAVIHFEIGKESDQGIKQLNKETGTTLFMVLLAVYNVLLHKYTGQTDILIGSPVSGRRHADLQNLLGVFVNMVVFRNQPAPGISFTTFLEQVKANAVEAYEHQDYQFEELVRKLGLQGETGRNPIFDVGFVLQTMESGDMAGSIIENQLKVTPCESENRVSRFDMLLEVFVLSDRLLVNLEYSTQLFKKSSMEIFCNHYKEILQQVVEKKEMKLEDITISSDLQAVKSNPVDLDFEFEMK